MSLVSPTIINSEPKGIRDSVVHVHNGLSQSSFGLPRCSTYSIVASQVQRKPVSIADLGGTNIDLRYSHASEIRIRRYIKDDARIDKIGPPEKVINAFVLEVSLNSKMGEVHAVFLNGLTIIDELIKKGNSDEEEILSHVENNMWNDVRVSSVRHGLDYDFKVEESCEDEMKGCA
ncbi:hypothetical protein Tco_1549476 [Tanacetum coccineum]